EYVIFAATFGAMAFSTFVFDTLDVSTRLGRYLLQELTGSSSRVAGVMASAATAGTALLILLSAHPGSWRQFWVLFGTSNQLLAALTLLGITVWLYRSGKRYWYTLLPMIVVMVITLTALVLQIGAGWKVVSSGLAFNASVLNSGVSVALLVLAIVFIVEALRAVQENKPEAGPQPVAGD
ncbi:MAG: carbon starvation CstA 5TM domain-containing protein, partial [Terriglobales bacterium]